MRTGDNITTACASVAVISRKHALNIQDEANHRLKREIHHDTETKLTLTTYLLVKHAAVGDRLKIPFVMREHIIKRGALRKW